MKPLDPWRLDPETDEICVNRPDEVFVRQRGHFTRHKIDFSYERAHAAAVLTGAIYQQNVNEKTPIMGSDLPDGERLQALLPPCVLPRTASLTIRIPGKKVAAIADAPKRYNLSKWNKWSQHKEARQKNYARILAAYDAGDVVHFLEEIVRLKLNPVLCGPTGAGKTSMLNSLVDVIPEDERLITIENALEIKLLRHLNCVRTIYSHGDQGTAKVTQEDLLAATLRMRPDRIIIGELRDPAAVYLYVNEVMTGHSGSPSTVHGRSAQQAAVRLFNLFGASEGGKSYDKEAIIQQLGMVVDVIIPFREDHGEYEIGEVWLAPEAERRGESIAELFR